MRLRPSFAACAALGILVTASGSRADDAGGPPPNADQARRAEVVARVGPRTITVGEIEDRLGAMPPFQRAAYGDSPQAIRKKVLETLAVRDALLALGAEARHLDKELPTSYQLERARSNATLRALRAKLGPAKDIPMADVQRYFDENRARYDAPERLQLWRILCKSKEEAQTVLDLAKKDPTPKAFTDLAREHSIDKATYLRGGNLGFVALDGASNEPGLRIDAAIPKAASAVKDGELVPQPVAEGDNFAVVWRRGTLAASHKSVEDVAAQIRDTLWKQRVEAAQKALRDELRAKKVKDYTPENLSWVEIPEEDAAVTARGKTRPDGG